MRIGDICTRTVVTCSRETTVLEAARLMREHHVGDLVVVDAVDGKVRPVAIVTDRDLVIEVMAERLDAARLRVGDLIVDGLEAAAEDEGVHDAIWHMRGKGIRRLPVVDGRGQLAGVLTVDDVARFLAEELVDVGRIASAQVKREGARRPPR